MKKKKRQRKRSRLGRKRRHRSSKQTGGIFGLLDTMQALIGNPATAPLIRAAVGLLKKKK